MAFVILTSIMNIYFNWKYYCPIRISFIISQ